MKVKLMIISIILLLVMVFACGCIPFMENIGMVSPTNEEQLSPEKGGPPDGLVKVLIGFKEKPGPAEQAIVQGVGGKIKYTYNLIPAMAASIPEKAIEVLKKNPNITEIEMDTKVYTCDDIELDNCWGVERIGAGIAHDYGYTGSKVKVAVIDTGIDDLHNELSIEDYYDFITDRHTNPEDVYGHGTHVAGIIAAKKNVEGAVGVAPDVLLYDLKALGDDGSGWVSDIIEAIQWASDPNGNGKAEDRLDIINMSFGAEIGNIFLKWACNLAYRDGLLLVAAAGNKYGGSVGYPAAYDRVVAVSATDINNQLADFSSTGSEVELAAPGEGIYSTVPGGGYDSWSGTSMACPHVVGAAALVWAENLGWSNKDVRSHLQETATDLGASGRDSLYGYGLVNATAALGLDEEDTTPPGQVTGLSAAAVSSSQIDLSWDSNTETDLVYYNVYRDSSLIANSEINSYSDTDLSSSMTYCYMVSAVDTSGNEGLLSDPVSETTYPSAEDKMMYVENISFLQESSKPRDNLHITVKVVENNGSFQPLSDVEVMMNLSWILTNNKTGARDFNGTTNNSGEVTFTIMKAREGNYTATITGLTLSGYIWNTYQGITYESYTLSK